MEIHLNLGNFASSPMACVDMYMCSWDCQNWNKENLIALLKNNEKPEWWKGNHKICYRLFNKIIETTCSLEDNQEERVKRSLHVLDPNIIIPAHACKTPRG